MMTEFEINDGVLEKYNGSDLDVIIPDQVICIGRNCFQLQNIQSIFLGDNVEQILSSAFWGCKNLTTVRLSENLKIISSYAFNDCSSLTQILFPQSLESIETEAFFGCHNLKASIPASVKNIGVNAFSSSHINFWENPNFKIVNGLLCSSDEVLGIYDDSNVNITIPEGYTKFKSIFSNHKIIQSVTVCDTVRILEKQTFSCCENLSRVIIPDGLEVIESGAFFACPKLSMKIPSSVKKIGACALDFKNVDLSDNKRFFIKNGLLCDNEFALCYIDDSIKMIVVPDGIKYVAKCLFFGKGIEEVSLPASIERIEQAAFMNCKQLKKIVLSHALEEIAPQTFQDINRACKIIYPGTEEEFTFVQKDSDYSSWKAKVVFDSSIKMNYCIDENITIARMTRERLDCVVSVQPMQSGDHEVDAIMKAIYQDESFLPKYVNQAEDGDKDALLIVLDTIIKAKIKENKILAIQYWGEKALKMKFSEAAACYGVYLLNCKPDESNIETAIKIGATSENIQVAELCEKIFTDLVGEPIDKEHFDSLSESSKTEESSFEIAEEPLKHTEESECKKELSERFNDDVSAAIGKPANKYSLSMENMYEIKDGVLVKWLSKKHEAIVPDGVKIIGPDAFSGFVKTIRLPKSVQEIRPRAFRFMSDDNTIVYAGDAETFSQMNIALNGNSAFIKKLEKTMGVKCKATKEKEAKPKNNSGKTKKAIVAEYIEGVAQEFNIETVDEFKFDRWKNIIVEHGGLFQFQYEQATLLVQGKKVSAKCARDLGKMQRKNALNEYCVGVKFNFGRQNIDKLVEKIMEGKEPNWDKIYATSFKAVPMETAITQFTPSDSSDGLVIFEEYGRMALSFVKLENELYFTSVYISNFTEMPKNGNLFIPFRLRMSEGEIVTTENLQECMGNGKLGKFGRNLVEEGTKHGTCIDFYVDEIQHRVFIASDGGYLTYEITDYSIGMDEKGYFIDAIVRLEISPKDYLWV